MMQVTYMRVSNKCNCIVQRRERGIGGSKLLQEFREIEFSCH